MKNKPKDQVLLEQAYKLVVEANSNQQDTSWMGDEPQGGERINLVRVAKMLARELSNMFMEDIEHASDDTSTFLKEVRPVMSKLFILQAQGPVTVSDVKEVVKELQRKRVIHPESAVANQIINAVPRAKA